MMDDKYKGNKTSPEYVYPFDDKCYSTKRSGKFRTKPLPDTRAKDGYIEYQVSDRILGSATGFLSNYNGNGFKKVVHMNMTNENFFADMF